MESGGKVAPPQLAERTVRELVDAAFDALVISRAGKIVFANRAFMEFSGAPASDVIGRSMLDFVAPESHESVIAHMKAGTETRYEAVGLRPDGSRIDVEVCARTGDFDGEPVRISAIRVITERKAAERALRRSEEQLRRLIERLPDMIVVHRDGEIVFANPAALRYLGHDTLGDLVGSTVFDLLHVGDRDAVRTTWASADDQRALPLVTARITRRDGGVGVVEIAATPIDELDGGPAVILLARDVMERQTIESRLVQADLLSSIGMLAAGIAHEINNPLAYVTLNLSAMTRALATLRERNEDEQIQELDELLSMTREGADRVRHIVHDFRVFARGSAPGRSMVEIPHVLDAAIKLAFSLRHRARLVREFEPIPLVEADEARLGQLFLNLVTNALQALDERGDDARADCELRVRTSTAQDGSAVIEIEDNGPGIAPQNLGRVFEPFFSTKAPGVGTGLGLPICKSIVAALGGSITLDSTVGRGTICRVVLPAFDGSAPVARPAAVKKEHVSRRVLVVDDEPALLRSLAEELRRHHTVTCVSSGTAAVECIARDEFDAIVCDVMMPSTSGIDVYEAVRLRRPGLERRIVFVTAGAFTAGAREFLAAVPNAKLEKPFTTEELCEAIDEAARSRDD